MLPAGAGCGGGEPCPSATAAAIIALARIRIDPSPGVQTCAIMFRAVRDRQSAILYICAADCALLFAAVALLVAHGSTIVLDTAIRNQIHARANGGLTDIAQALSLIGSAKVWVPGLAIAVAGCWMAD